MQKLIRATIQRAGGQSAVARALGVRQQSVQQWIASGRIPPCRVLGLSRLTGVPPSLLRPDLYPLDEMEFFLSPSREEGER